MFNKFRFCLAMKLLTLVIILIDKKTLEGLSFVVAIDEWVKYLEISTPKVNK